VNEPEAAAVCVVDPEVASIPDHNEPFAPPPPAVQPVAPTEDHVRVMVPPLVTLVGLAVSVAVRGEIDRFACVDTAGEAASMLEHVRPNVYWPAGPDSESVPEAGTDWTLPPHEPPGTPPVRRQLPELVADQDAVNDWPAATVAGLKVIVGTGGGGACTVRVTLVLVEYGPVSSVGKHRIVIG
jgi:hypothetical protein